MAAAPHVLLTGATDGIGLSLARLYGRDGAQLTLVGRRRLDGLDPTLFTPATYCRADLGEHEAIERICRHLGTVAPRPLDVVIHNAGIGWVGPIGVQSAASVCNLAQVNLWTPVALTHALLAKLRARSGKVVFVGSVAAALPCPDYAAYAAFKAALDGFARSLRVELSDRVAIQVVHPGATRTSMHAKAGGKSSARFAAPERVAGAIKRAIAGSRPVVTIGLGNAAVRVGGRGLTTVVDVAARAARTRRLEPAVPARSGRASAVVTGAANGIGSALARRLLDDGFGVLCVDNDRAAMAAAESAANADGRALMLAETDLAGAESVERLVDTIAAERQVDVLVHNAATSAVGAFATAPLAAQRRVLEVNLLAPMLLTAGLLARRRLAPGATVVFVSSLSHFVSYPGASVYAATKDGLASSRAACLSPRAPVACIA